MNTRRFPHPEASASVTDPNAERNTVRDARTSGAALDTGASATASGWFDFWVRRGWRIWMLAVAVFVADQVSKALISNWLRWGDSWPEEGWLRLTHARNTGAAFSILEGQSTLLSIVSLVAIVLILWLYRASGNTSLLLRIALSLQLGGAFGNLIDRVRQGYVVDFFDVGPWPIFNVADSSITMGIGLLLVYVFFGQRSSACEAQTGSSPAIDTATSTVRYCEACYRRRAHLQRLEMQARSEALAAADAAVDVGGARATVPGQIDATTAAREAHVRVADNDVVSDAAGAADPTSAVNVVPEVARRTASTSGSAASDG